MSPVKFPECNVALHAPSGMESSVETLHVFADGTYLISLWKLSWGERLSLLFSGRIWLWVMSAKTQPPVSITAGSPFRHTLRARILARIIKISPIGRWLIRRHCRKAVEEAFDQKAHG